MAKSMTTTAFIQNWRTSNIKKTYHDSPNYWHGNFSWLKGKETNLPNDEYLLCLGA